jgi:hypothetical protein
MDMIDNSKNKENQPIEDIDEVIDDAVEKAEARKELSDGELDDVSGGIPGGHTMGRMQA